MFPILYPSLPPGQMIMPGFDVDDEAVSCLNWRWIGKYGEWLAETLLKKSGFLVSPSHVYGGDLRAVYPPTGELLRVEVKTARKSAAGYQFCLKRLYKDGRVGTNASDADLLILLPILGSYAYPFVVPASFVPAVQNFTMPSSPLVYKGKLARFASFSLPLCIPGVND